MPRLLFLVTTLSLGFAMMAGRTAVGQQPSPQSSTPPTVSATADPMAIGKQALAHGDYQAAQTFFASYLRDNPDSAEALFFTGNAALGLKQYDDAVRNYQSVIAKQPSMWHAHKNLVIVYAAQGKWSEFDQERKLLQDARSRGVSGLSPKDADVIEVLDVGPERYIVRAYAELTGHFKTRYNFAHFGKDGKLDFWIACESDDVDQTFFAQKHPKEAAAGQRSFSLDSYTATVRGADGQSSQTHGTHKFYPDGEPTYETVRADVLNVLNHKAGPMSSTTPTAKPETPKAEPPAPK